MDKTTNLLRERGKRFAAPLAAGALALFSGALIFGHNHVNAAVALDNTIAPINNASIDPLLALDQATEAVQVPFAASAERDVTNARGIQRGRAPLVHRPRRAHRRRES